MKTKYRWALRLGIWFIGWSSSLEASSLWVSEPGTGSYRFAQEVERASAFRPPVGEEALVARVEPQPLERLERLRHYQGEWAILEAEQAFRLLPHYPELAVAMVLWPCAVHILTNAAEPKPLSFATSFQTIYLTPDLLAFAEVWGRHHSLQEFQADRLHWITQATAPFALKNLEQALWMISAPMPLLEVIEASQHRSNLQWLPLSQELISAIQERVPYFRLQESSPPASLGLKLPPQILVQAPVLITRVNWPAERVKRWLAWLLVRAQAPQASALWQKLSPQTNALFRPVYRFHAGSMRFFEWTESSLPAPPSFR